MIIETHTCPRCESSHLTRNGKTKTGKQKFRCRTCGCCGTPDPDYGYSEGRKAEILRACHARSSLRGLERTFGVARQTVSAWLKKARDLPPLDTTLAPAQPEDVLELDALWSFVQCKASTCWVYPKGHKWVALCRRTRQVVSWFAGDRSADSCRQLWDGIPEAYRCAHTCSEFWQAYPGVFGENHPSVGKETGETAHVERWNNTLRQRLARFVRKSLSFCKNDRFHRIALQLFIHEYNLEHAS